MTTFGRYEIISELGRGGMAQVFHAHDPRFEREVAVKVLPREFLSNPQFHTRFEREARALAALQHKAIVPVHDIGEEDGQPYLVMAYMSGGSLADKIEQGPLSLEESARIISQLAPALDYAHQHGMIHRDLKPDNVLFDRFDDAYLSDFGIVRLSESTTQLTGASILGTPAYMAPELVDDIKPTPMVDIYSLGVTLFRMLAGQLPYNAPTPVGVLTAHVTKPIPDIRALNPNLPHAIQQVINTAMAKDPAERYMTATQLSEALNTIAASAEGYDSGDTVAVNPARQAEATLVEDVPTPPPAPPPPQTEPIAAQPPPARTEGRRSGMGLFATIGVLVLVGLIVGGIVLSGMLRQDTPQEVVETDTPALEETETAEIEEATADVEEGLNEESDPPPIQTGEPNYVEAASLLNSDFVFAFQSTRDNEETEIYLMDILTREIARLTDNDDYDGTPAWSPDGSQIAFSSGRDAGDGYRIYVMDADGSNAVRLTDTTEIDWDPAWSPDGSQIAFSSNRDGDFDIYVMEADGSNLRQLTTNSDSVDRGPKWSPDGSQIAFFSNRFDDSFDIYVMSADGENAVRMTDHSAADFAPAWSPDGSVIAFVSERDGRRQIYMINADGTGVRRVTDSETDDSLPGWTPNGLRLIFDRDFGYRGFVVIDPYDSSTNAIIMLDDGLDDYFAVWRPYQPQQ